jgi:hypothetical protein
VSTQLETPSRNSTPRPRVEGLTGRFVLVLVLESGHPEFGVWEYCAKSELHPRRGLEVLKGGADLFFASIPGVKTPGSFLLSLRDSPTRAP